MSVSDLSKLSAMWKKVTPIAASFSNIPDNDYIGDIKEIKLGQSKKGRYQVVLDWEVADGEYAGKTQKQFYGISDDKGNPDETGMGYFKNVCEVMGLDLPEDINAWQEHMDVFVENNKLLFNITAKANGNYTNVYCNGVSDYTKGTEEEAAAAEEEIAAAEEVVEEAVEEVVEEEVIEEVAEEVQEVVMPTKKIVAKPVAKPVAKLPVAKPVAKLPAKPVAKAAVAQPVKKVVQLARR